MEASTPPQLRPLGVGEILDRAFKVYKAHFKTLVMCVLVPVVPITILMVLFLASIEESSIGAESTPSADEGLALAGFGVTVLFTLLLTLLATAACVRAVSAAYLNDDVSWQQSLKFGLRKLFPLIVATFLAAIATAFGLIGLIIGAIYIYVRFSVTTPALLVEDTGPLKALGRSWELVKGRWWATFGTTLIATLLVAGIGQIIQGVLIAPAFADADNEVLSAVMTGLGQIVSSAITLPLQAAILTILYFDLRVRKEGLDLSLLAEQFGSPGPADVARSSGLGGYDAPRAPQGQPGESSSYGGFSAPRSPDRPDQPT